MMTPLAILAYVLEIAGVALLLNKAPVLVRLLVMVVLVVLTGAAAEWVIQTD